MSKRQVAVELQPDRIDVVAYAGSVRVQARRLTFETETDGLEWARAIRRSAASVRRIVEELGIEGQGARVLYRSPTQAVELFSGALRSPVEAIEAAKLSCCDALSYSSLSAVCQGAVVGRDAGANPRQLHAVVAAEREDVADAVVAMVAEAGLELVSMTPLEAAVASHVLYTALADRRPHQGWLYVGEHASLFVVASEGRIVFSRRIALGADTLIRALTRPLRVAGYDELVMLAPDDARRIIAECGIPDRDRVVHDALGLSGAQVVPMLQPVLQRFIVELRQSLRFGVRDEDRAAIRIDMTGPGASIPSLAQLVGDELGVKVRADEAYAVYDWAAPGSDAGELADAMRRPALLGRINLLPEALARTRTHGRFRQWLWTGAAVAMVLIAVDGFRYHAQLRAAREEAASLRVADLETLRATEDRLRAAVDAMNQLEATIRAETHATVDFRACLQELTLITPDSVRFTSMSFERREDRTVGSIGGYAFLPGEGERSTELETFIDALRRSPLFEQVVLQNVQVGSIGDLRGQRFETMLVLTPIAEELVAAGARRPEDDS